MTKIQTDRAYHHGDLRQSLIEAACVHLRESGADTLSLRALARQVGVSQTAPYRHFDSKNALFAAIAVYGFTLLEADIRAARDRCGTDIEKAIVEVGYTYIQWAIANPEKYQLFFDSSLVGFQHFEELVTAGQKSFNVISEIIAEGIKRDILIDRPVALLAGSMWTSIHGIASILISKSGVQELEIESPVLDVITQLSNDPRSSITLFLDGIRKH